MERDLPTTGVLTSPNYPERYPHDLNQVQKIQVPEGNTIWIRFTDFDVEREYDTVTITDKDGTRLGLFDIVVYSYADWRREIESYTDTVEVVFRTDVSGSDMGWRLEWGKYKFSITILLLFILLAPTGALIVIVFYYWSARAPTFSDFEHFCQYI